MSLPFLLEQGVSSLRRATQTNLGRMDDNGYALKTASSYVDMGFSAEFVASHTHTYKHCEDGLTLFHADSVSEKLGRSDGAPQLPRPRGVQQPSHVILTVE